MGASGWTYEVAWQPDLQAALTLLCDEAFANGDYLKEWEDDDWDFEIPTDFSSLGTPVIDSNLTHSLRMC
jgi:hypothetical protein